MAKAGSPNPTSGGQSSGGPAVDLPPINVRVAAVSVNTPATHGDWVLLASFNESLLDKEFRLQNDRISWMMTSQSVLLAAFCLLLTNRTADAKTVELLLNMIPILAIVIVVGALVGVPAAQDVIYHLEHERSFFQAVLSKLFEVPLPDVGSGRQGRIKGTRKRGFLPIIIIMLIMLCIWVIVIGYRLNINIHFNKIA
jgi:amino acid permease